MHTPIPQPLQQLITQRTGLLLRDTELGELSRYVAERMAALKMTNVKAFLARLTASEEEWADLYRVITTGESYFLRDRGQISLLQSHILPDLLARRAKERTLSVWSAGCSTGEEVYSLAILLDQIGTECSLDLAGWRITLLGTDLNPAACRHAQAGVYGKWSFRGVPAEIQSRYFLPHGADQWRVKEPLRRFVRFHPLNLLQDAYPAAGSVDLILCRNVLIYMTDPAIVQVVEKFAQSLRPDGYLLTGHGEFQGQSRQGLISQLLPGSTVYRRQTQPSGTTLTPPTDARSINRGTPPTPIGPSTWPRPSALTRESVSPPAPSVDSRSPQFQEKLTTAQAALDRGESDQAMRVAQEILAQAPEFVPAYLLLAQAQANLGHLSQAQELCAEAIKINPLAPMPHYLLAHIAQELGDLGAAHRHYQKILYLDPSFVPALLELSMLMDQPEERNRAKQLRRSAREALLALPSDQRVAPYTENAGQLLAQWADDGEIAKNGIAS